jgi:hypothetical protein
VSVRTWASRVGGIAGNIPRLGAADGRTPALGPVVRALGIVGGRAVLAEFLVSPACCYSCFTFPVQLQIGRSRLFVTVPVPVHDSTHPQIILGASFVVLCHDKTVTNARTGGDRA